MNGNCEICQPACGWRHFIFDHKREETNVLEIQKVIAKAGHDTGGFKALQEDYDDLHSCCQYKRG